MLRQNMIVVALGTVALAALPLAHANAQSGDAVAHAESTCVNHGVAPRTADFDICVNRAASAFDQGLPDVAERQAGLVRDANDVCRSYGIAPATLGYRECVSSEIERRTAQPARYIPAARSAMTVDAYGFRYDAHGNLFDRDGYPIRPVPVR